MLGWILERWDGVMWTGLVWLRIGTGGELLFICLEGIVKTSVWRAGVPVGI
jgi:hypothetical protein